MLNLNEDIGYIELVKIVVIILLSFLKGLKFDLMSAMIRLLYLNDMFTNLLTDDAKVDIMNFVGICTLYNLPGVSQEVVKTKVINIISYKGSNIMVRGTTSWIHH